MNRLWVYAGISIVLMGMMVGVVSAQWISQSMSQSSSSYWSPFGGYTSMQQSSQSFMSGGFPGSIFGGNYFQSFSSYVRSTFGPIFFANGTQIADVSGVWNTDLLGNVTVRLTGDDIIRASYMVDDKDGYIQGNFTSNASPVMDGFWWEGPDYRPLYQAGAIQITFVNNTALTGVFAYADGTWGPFTGMKVRANLTQEEDDLLVDMPKLDWTIDENQTSDMRVNNSVDTNPIAIP